jgi:hypothetical protein
MEWIDIVAKEHEWLNDPGQAREAAQQWARTRHRVTPAEVGHLEMGSKLAGALLGDPPPGDACGADGREVRRHRHGVEA